ncbi:hypothetical protein L9F63_023883, partial [Diploptera punctata]
SQVKIWFQNRRSKYKKMMKAAQQVVSNAAPHTPGTIPGANSPQPPGGGII